MADINTAPLAPPLLLGLRRQLLKADPRGRELASEADAHSESLEQVHVGGHHGPVLEGGLRADLSVPGVGVHPQDGCGAAAGGERHPAVDVVVAVLVDGEHVVVFPVASPCWRR